MTAFLLDKLISHKWQDNKEFSENVLLAWFIRDESIKAVSTIPATIADGIILNEAQYSLPKDATNHLAFIHE